MFVQIPQNTFSELVLEAGVLLTTFDISNPAAPNDEDIICATTGGISISCVPTYSDMGEDIDNCPNNTKELKHLDGWECTASTTALNTTPEMIALQLGAADIKASTPAENITTITPKMSLDSEKDFKDIWWVADVSDGGLAAVKIANALSTGGFVLQTTKNGKGQYTLEIMGHPSIKTQSTVPMEFYVATKEALAGA